jgi:DNA adenine methylase
MKKARPFVKWVGGKNQLLEQFENYYPYELRKGTIKNYVEPFLGGGALFFALSQCYKTAMIFDEPNILAVSKVLQNTEI